MQGDQSEDDDNISIQDGQSDKDYDEGYDSLSDGESASVCETEVGSGSSDEEECAFDHDYGDIEETGGHYVVVMEELGLEVTIKKHTEICGCGLDALRATHFIKGAESDNDSDSGEKVKDEVDEDDVKDDAMDGDIEEADGNGSAFEDDDEED
jgi:hypothetical protein